MTEFTDDIFDSAAIGDNPLNVMEEQKAGDTVTPVESETEIPGDGKSAAGNPSSSHDRNPETETVPTQGTSALSQEAMLNMPRMIPYNSGMPRINMPEYGRNIQNLICYCVGIEDRTERTECAYAIAEVMAGLFPETVGDGKDMKKIWDQMQIISDFRLDVDFPYETVTKAQINPVPKHLPYETRRMRFRHYGSNVEKMIMEVCKMDNGEEKDILVNQLANHMKKLLTLHNREGVSDARVLQDLALFSHGHILLTPETYPLMEFQEETVSAPTKKRKKKR